ncbi:peptide deformylase [Anseongella ginsenosidimutans]|uniref:Peptide deformylase n=1 Tax=Anseongella ginsenosidimutans TaxID=496056 RepID=A0A4R3KNK6_9SPHI|nr:peptide deformylase [Anseongella ginsenosidimutans]QEC52060.1 peptide deformylase [Anseongella ginsenosidimutans]TCS85629.1 peptide deformylase [Anseongella ginsenosidimutans]
MILPIVAYGDAVLRKKCEEIGPDYPELDRLIADMFETMYQASGVGLAAPQIGQSIRLFVIDASPYGDDEDSLKDFKKIFINAEILERGGKDWSTGEGCLSIPDIREDVSRPEDITIRYMDEEFGEHTETYSGMAARIIQHEYDHVEGKLFTDYLSPLKKRMLQNRLNAISKGEIRAEYRMRFPKPSRKRR